MFAGSAGWIVLPSSRRAKSMVETFTFPGDFCGYRATSMMAYSDRSERAGRPAFSDWCSYCSFCYQNPSDGAKFREDGEDENSVCVVADIPPLKIVVISQPLGCFYARAKQNDEKCPEHAPPGAAGFSETCQQSSGTKTYDMPDAMGRVRFPVWPRRQR